jgi:PAS domain-containing protein
VARATELLETTGSLAKVGGWEVNLQTMKLSWTREAFRIAELESGNEPALGEGLKLFAPEARPTISAAVQAAIAFGTPYDPELPLIAANGQCKWVRTHGFAEMNEVRALRIPGIFQDVSKRKAAEAAQRERESRYKTLIEQAAICLQELDLDGKLTSMKGAGLAMMGLTDQCQIRGLNNLTTVTNHLLTFSSRLNGR